MPKKDNLKRKTDLDRLNELIDWYIRNKPDAGHCIQVRKGPRALHEMLGIAPALGPNGKPEYPLEVSFRGRTILAIGKDA